MEGMEAICSDKSSLVAPDSEGVEKLKGRLEQLPSVGPLMAALVR